MRCLHSVHCRPHTVEPQLSYFQALAITYMFRKILKEFLSEKAINYLFHKYIDSKEE